MAGKVEKTPMEKRALALAETTLEFGFRLRHQSSQIPGLALILKAFAENEIRLAKRSPTTETESPHGR